MGEPFLPLARWHSQALMPSSSSPPPPRTCQRGVPVQRTSRGPPPRNACSARLSLPHVKRTARCPCWNATRQNPHATSPKASGFVAFPLALPSALGGSPSTAAPVGNVGTPPFPAALALREFGSLLFRPSPIRWSAARGGSPRPLPRPLPPLSARFTLSLLQLSLYSAARGGGPAP